MLYITFFPIVCADQLRIHAKLADENENSDLNNFNVRLEA